MRLCSPVTTLFGAVLGQFCAAPPKTSISARASPLRPAAHHLQQHIARMSGGGGIGTSGTSGSGATGAKQHPRLAVGQLCSTSDPDYNLAECTAIAKAAKSQGAAFLSLPECFAFMGTPGTSETRENAQPLTGELFSRYKALAKETGMWLSLGGFHETCEEEKGKIYNTHAVLDANGELVATYRKLHLFDVDVDGGFKESNSTARGQHGLIIKNTPVGNVGVTVCYDLRFPELYTALRDAGAQVILVPSAFMPTTGQAHWEVLLRSRAIETQCYVAAAAQYGQHNGKRSSWGHALLVSPWGDVLSDLGGEQGGVGVCDIDFEGMEGIRARMPVENHRRRDVVSVVVGEDGSRMHIVDAGARSAL